MLIRLADVARVVRVAPMVDELNGPRLVVLMSASDQLIATRDLLKFECAPCAHVVVVNRPLVRRPWCWKLAARLQLPVLVEPDDIEDLPGQLKYRDCIQSS